MASASSSGWSHSQPVTPCSTISAAGPLRSATTGVPQASASTIATLNGQAPASGATRQRALAIRSMRCAALGGPVSASPSASRPARRGSTGCSRPRTPPGPTTTAGRPARWAAQMAAWVSWASPSSWRMTQEPSRSAPNG
jgi:hypothetical protein